ncbi:MAG: hypothetical protein JNK60_09385, partial [Acidobacteria bacterium]|nr:hypothetical protein [Acidobacteriota bacterium]
ALTSLITEDESLEIPLMGGRGVHPIKRREVAEILQPRAEELLTVIWEDATRDVPASELRAGLVLTGGAAQLHGLLEVAEQILGVTVRKGLPRGLSGLTDIVAGPEWACVAGLLLWNLPQAEKAQAMTKGTPGFLDKFKTTLKGLFPQSNAL